MCLFILQGPRCCNEPVRRRGKADRDHGAWREPASQFGIPSQHAVVSIGDTASDSILAFGSFRESRHLKNRARSCCFREAEKGWIRDVFVHGLRAVARSPFALRGLGA
ncbi:hypothetical protein CP533_3506 [Ophiocordyceps camponoti-saundersi (nom. inval.)]|nr:hypothetical protein CP533_3506 [Ophiocordyceps camponoti-saundersi (nom. inval.)]